MSTWINRTTLRVERNAHTPDFSDPPWLQLATNSDGSVPALDALAGVHPRYWKLTGDTLEAMTQPERDAVDAAEAAAILSGNRTAAAGAPDGSGELGMRTREMIELHNKRVNWLANRVIELQNVVNALLSNGAWGASKVDAETHRSGGAFMVTATRTRAEAIAEYKASIAAGEVDP